MIATKRDKPVALSEANNELLALNWDGGNEAFRVSDFPEVFAAERFAVPQSELKPGGWQLEPPVKRRLLERLRKAGQPLGEYCKGRFYYGIKTGLNEAFVITREQRDALVAQDPQSAEIIKPFLRGRDVQRWNVESQNLWLIFIPWHFPLHEDESITGPSKEAEVAFRKGYPAIYRHLSSFKSALSARNLAETGVRYEWYALQRWGSSYWQEFSCPKIFIPAIAASPIAGIDQTGYFSNNKTTIFIPPSVGLAAACVNSPIAAWLAVQTFATKQGGFFDFDPRYSRQIPIPAASTQQVGVIECLVEAVTVGISRPEYERLLNGLVYELFFPEDLHARNIRLFDACTAAGICEGMDAQAVAARIFRNDHPIYGQLFDLRALDVVRIIESVE